MEMQIIAQGENDPPKLTGFRQPVVDLSEINAITFCVIQGGMQSGEPSVMIVSETDAGSVVLQTSLDKFLSGASAMATIAEDRWGWKRPEGHYTIMPPDPQTRKAMLESIKQELEEWDDASPTS